MTNPMQELSARAQQRAAEWRRRGAELRAVIASASVTGSDGLTQMRLSAVGAIQAIGFADGFSSKSMIELTTSVMRVQGALTDFLRITDGVERNHMRNIRIAPNVVDDDPEFSIRMHRVTSPHSATMGPDIPLAGASDAIARMAEQGAAALRPYVNPDAPTRGYDQWARDQVEAAVRETIAAAEPAAEHEVATSHLTARVNSSGRLTSVTFSTSITRLSAEELAANIAEAIMEGLSMIRTNSAHPTQEA